MPTWNGMMAELAMTGYHSVAAAALMADTTTTLAQVWVRWLLEHMPHVVLLELFWL